MASALPTPNPAAAALRTAGQLTLIGVPTDAQGETIGGDGWYGLASVGRAGKLHYLVRCPEHANWCGEVESLDWSRNGRWLALSVTSYGSFNPYNGLHVIDLLRGTDRQISSCCGDPLDVAWSPDSSKLAYVIHGPGAQRIRIVDRDGSHDRPFPSGTPGSDWSPSWSPSGDAIAYATRPRPHRGAAVWIQRLDGSQRRLLASGVSNPAWSPDGHTIAVVSRCGGIKLLTPGGLDITPGIRRCRDIPISGFPVWSPDGKRLAIAGVWSRQVPYDYRVGVVYVIDRSGHQELLTRESGGRAVNNRVDASWQPRLQPGS